MYHLYTEDSTTNTKGTPPTSDIEELHRQPNLDASHGQYTYFVLDQSRQLTCCVTHLLQLWPLGQLQHGNETAASVLAEKARPRIAPSETPAEIRMTLTFFWKSIRRYSRVRFRCPISYPAATSTWIKGDRTVTTGWKNVQANARHVASHNWT